VLSVHLNVGPIAGGASVVVRGQHFSPHLVEPIVMFGGQPATVTKYGHHFADVIEPPGSPGPVDVRVTSPHGTSAITPADQYTYGYPPSVTGVVPTAGPDAGHNTVTIDGTNFVAVQSVDFGATPGRHVVVDPSGLSLTVQAPRGTANTTVDLVVTTPSGVSTITWADEYTYLDPTTPVVNAVSPDLGPTSGSTVVDISGQGFTGATSVQFGAGAATNVVVNSDTSITATSPPGNGVVDVMVTTPGGTSHPNPPLDQFVYEDAPTITSIVPSRGPAFGGTSVTISGTGLFGATAVTFGGNAAMSYTAVSPTEITAVSPAGSGTVDVLVTNPIGTSTPVTADEFTYILGTAEAWGANSAGQLGNGTTTDDLTPGPVSDLPMVVDMSSGGDDFSNAVTFMGDVYAWGDNTLDELGTGNTTSSSTPVPVVGVGGSGTLGGMVAVASGDASGYALSGTGNVYAWGDNTKGELGNNSTVDSSTPVEVVGPGGSGFLSGIVAVSSRGNAAYALTASGNVYAWGNDAFGELGNGVTGGQSDVPVLVQQVGGGGTLDNVAAVSAGAEDGYAILAGGQVVSWGYNVDGELGNGTSGSTHGSNVPVDVSGLNDAVAVTGGVFHALAVTTSGAVEAWGANNSGELGLPLSTLGSDVPVDVSGVGNVIDVNGGDGFSLALTSSGDLYAWGYNVDGELGLGTQSSTPTTSPTLITAMTAFEAVGAGWTQSLGIEN